MLASSVDIPGTSGQGNYAAGNAYDDALAPATTIDVGWCVAFVLLQSMKLASLAAI